MVERVSTAQTPSSASAECVPYEPSPYPWGLRLSLSAEQLAQFGIGIPNAGDSFDVDALGVVVRCSMEDQDADGDVDSINVEIQLTELALTKSGTTKGADAAKSLYGDKD